jgi:hypothetical protein
LCQGCGRAPSTETTAVSPAAQIDSLVWRNPTVAHFIDSVLSLDDPYRYTGFHFTGSSPIGKRRLLGKYKGEESFRGDSNWTWSPDNSRAISIGRYFGEPDHNLEIFNRDGDSTFVEFEFCGTPCEYLGVKWVDPNQFVFVQKHEILERGTGNESNSLFLVDWTAFVSLYNLSMDSVYSYSSKPARRQPNW